MSDTNKFELDPAGKNVGENSGAVEKAAEWAATMAGMPEKNYMDVIKTGQKVSEALSDNNKENNEVKDEGNERHDEGIENAQSLSGALADAVAKYGIESTIQKLNSCDLSGSTNPIGDLYYYFGLGTAYESEETAKHEGAVDSGMREAEKPASQNQDVEGILAAIDDMKELINEVQGASPVYEELREGARAAGMGYFEYAVSRFGTQGLPELFQVLKEQKERSNEVDEKQKEQQEQQEQQDDVWGRQEVVKKERLNPGITDNRNAA